MNHYNITKKIPPSKHKINRLSDKRKLEFLLALNTIFSFTKKEIYSYFNTSRQAIDYHSRKKGGKNE